MVTRFWRGSAFATSMTVLFVVFVVGSGLLSLSLQSMRRGHKDSLRVRALALAEMGAEKAIDYLRTTDPGGGTTGVWRTAGRTETVASQGEYTMVVQDGTAENAGKIVITATGRAVDAATTGSIQRTIRVVLKMEREDIGIWNNVVFGGVGQGGRSINGNVKIRGSVHLLGDGEPFTDVDGDGRWDSGEAFTDSDGSGGWTAGEPYTDADGDGHYDAREPYEDTNGNGTRDPALTVTDLSSQFGGTANVANNYTSMPADLRNLLPAVPTVSYGGETVESLAAKMRVKHGRVDISGTASVGNPNATGGSPAVKEFMDGVYVNDGFGGTAGSSQVYSDNGSRMKYNLGDLVSFPSLTSPVTVSGTSYTSYMSYLESQALVVTGPINIANGTAYGPITDGLGNSLTVDAAGNMVIQGIVYVNGDININRGSGEIRYSGKGTLVSTGTIWVHTNVLPSTATFPITHRLGMIARRRLELATGSGDAQLKMAGAFYAQEQIKSAKQNAIAGSFVTSYFSMTNVPDIYQVPTLSDNLPPGMPGSERIWIKTIRVDSWRET